MALLSFLKETITDFRGMWLVRDQARQSASRASFAQNVRFEPGKVKSRKGHSQILDLGSAAILSMYNWISAGDPTIAGTSRLVYLESPNIVGIYDLTGATSIATYTQAAAGISVAEAETRLYIAHFLASGIASGSVRVVNNLPSSSGTVDVAFPAPMTSTPSVVDSGAGSIDEGDHYFSYRIETRTGFPGKPANITPVLVTVASGGRKVTFSFTINVPSDAAILHVLMTSVDDPDTFYETGASIAVPAGTSAWPVSLDVDISDIALALDANDATDRFSYLTGASAPAASKTGRYGNRTFYIADKKIYISDPYNSQVLIEDQHAIQVEGARSLVTAEPLGSLLVIYALNSTFTVSGDNARVPRQWAPPQRRSDSIGTPAPCGVCPAAAMDGHWVAHPSGLNFFNGAYGDIPLSIMFDSDWKRINWVYGASIQMVDDPEARCLYINVPLDSATSPNYRMVIDYSRAKTAGGINPFEIDYVLDVYKVSGTVTALTSIARVRNETTKKNEIWAGRTDGTIMRQNPLVIADDGQAIHSIWETGLILARKLRQLSRFGGAHLDIKGTGPMTITPYGMNKQVEADDDPEALTLSASPDGEELSTWHMESENESIRFETNSATASFELSAITAYHKPVGSTKQAA